MSEKNLQAVFMSTTPEWGTPQEFFDDLNAEFDFTLDVCATPENAKCAEYYTWFHDGLSLPWHGERVWMNPPYGREIGLWVRKAAHEARRGAEVVVGLIPARPDTAYWHEYVWDAKRHAPREGVEVRFVRGRLTFIPAGGGACGRRTVPLCRSRLSGAVT